MTQIWRQTHPQSQLVVAADDSPEELKRYAHFKGSESKETEMIQAAIDEYSAGGTVLLLPGTYNISSRLKLRNGTVLQGAGASNMEPTSGTRLVAADGLNDHMVALADPNVSHFEVKDLVLLGNKAGQAEGSFHGIYADHTGTALLKAPRHLISNVLVYGTKANGIHAVQPSGAGGGVMDLFMARTRQCGGVGFVLGGYDIIASHCNALGNISHGWQIISNGTAAQIANSKADSNGGRGLYASGAGSLMLTGWRSLLNTGVGAEINQDYCNITGAILQDNGSAGTPQPALKLTAGVQGFDGSGISCLATAATMSYGCQIEAGATKVSLQGSSTGHITGHLLNSSVDTNVYTDGFVNKDA